MTKSGQDSSSNPLNGAATMIAPSSVAVMATAADALIAADDGNVSQPDVLRFHCQSPDAVAATSTAPAGGWWTTSARTGPDARPFAIGRHVVSFCTSPNAPAVVAATSMRLSPTVAVRHKASTDAPTFFVAESAGRSARRCLP